MKVVGIISIGTYWSPWFPYSVASVYPVCDEIVVSNIGFDMLNPKQDVFVSLDIVTDTIKQLDVSKKITELKNINAAKLQKAMPVMTQKQADDLHTNDWYDLRGVGLTAASEEAVRRGADWILKIDSDQAVYTDILKIRPYLEHTSVNGYKFHQYEFIGDIGFGECYTSLPEPSSPYNDSVFIYKAMYGQFYGGGGSPDLHLPGADRTDTDLFSCAHLRYANPAWLTKEEKFLHFFGRKWFANFTNQYSEFCRELDRKSKHEALSILADTGSRQLATVKPPEVCTYTDPVDYIRKWQL